MSSWFKLYRGWQSNPMFRNDRDRLNWLWLIENAAYDNVTISINNSPVNLQRGEMSYSIRYLSKAWGATPSYVRTFLKHLEKWQAISTQNDTGQTLITLCNYSKFQDIQSGIDTPTDKKVARPSQGHRTNNKKIKEIKNKEVIICPENVSSDVWQDWVKLRKKKNAVISERVINGFEEKATVVGWTLEQLMKKMVERNWQGFETHWVTKEKEKKDAMYNGWKNA